MKKNIIPRRICYIFAFSSIVICLCSGLFFYEKEKLKTHISEEDKKEETEESINYTVDIVKDQKESVIIKHYTILYGKDLWDSFLKDTENNKKSHICVYFTENEYNINNYIDLTYDGRFFTVKKYKNDKTEKYKYIYGFENTEKATTIFWLMNEEGITYEEHERRMISAIATPDNELESCLLFLIEG